MNQRMRIPVNDIKVLSIFWIIHYFEDIRKQKHIKCLPINDAIAMQEHESRRDFGGVKTRARLIELPGSLNLEHQISSVHVFHYKEQTVLDGVGWRGEGK